MRHRPLAALFLLATTLAGGPGLAGLEAYQHAHRPAPGHGHRPHFEQRGGSDHDDACRAWIGRPDIRQPCGMAAPIRAGEQVVFAVPHLSSPWFPDHTPLLPRSRAPPRPNG